MEYNIFVTPPSCAKLELSLNIVQTNTKTHMITYKVKQALFLSLSSRGASRGGAAGASGASAPVTLSLDPSVAPLTGSLH